MNDKNELIFKSIVESNIENHFEAAVPNVIVTSSQDYFKRLQEKYKDIIEDRSVEVESVSLYDLDLVTFDNEKHTILFIDDIDDAIEFDNYNLDIIRYLILFGRIEKKDQLEIIDLNSHQVTPVLHVKNVDSLLLTNPEEFFNVWMINS